jgi:CTP synthase
MRFSGGLPDCNLVEMVEITDHPWFVACQFHPELKSRPTRPHPLFAAFIRAALERRNKIGAGAGQEEVKFVDQAPRSATV